MNTTNCPRCKCEIECRSDNIKSCFCFSVELSPALDNFLKHSYFNTCLCFNCLEGLETTINQAALHPISSDLTRLKEGIHFEIENGHLVFTSLYLVARGYCCNNGCRNCPYGYQTTTFSTS